MTIPPWSRSLPARRLLTLAIAATLVAATAAPAAAATVVPDSDSSLQERVDAVMREFPGGVQIADDSISWQRGEVVMTLEGGSNARSVATCVTGSYCAWSGINYTGNKLSFTACSWAGTSSSLAALITKRSYANARTTGTVRVVNGASTVHTLPAGTGIPNSTAASTAMVCFYV
jgi:hypothetical protein